MVSILSSEERVTIETYNRTAVARRQTVNNTPFNPNFWLPEVRRLADLVRGGNILDIGCGDARHAWRFREDLNFKYFGVDLSEGMITEAKFHSPDAAFARMNFYNLGFRDETFDCFWAAAALFHSPRSRAGEALWEVRRVLKTGGHGFISMKEGEGERMIGNPEKGGQRLFSFYSLAEFYMFLRSCGFQVFDCWRDQREYNPPVCDNVWLLYFVRKI